MSDNFFDDVTEIKLNEQNVNDDSESDVNTETNSENQDEIDIDIDIDVEDNTDGIEQKLKEKQKELKKLNEDFTKKNEDYNVLYDKYLRVNAEYDNFRKRTAKEKEGIYADAVADVLKTILPVLDNIERAIQFSENPDAVKISEGIKIIHAQFLNSLNQLGVEEIKAEGEQFNPEVHNAVFHEEDESQPDNTVTEALQKGYIKGDKVIRPAMVKVVN